MISFKGFTKEGVSTYEKLNKALDSVGGALYALEKNYQSPKELTMLHNPSLANSKRIG
jgi:hypothetical protein